MRLNILVRYLKILLPPCLGIFIILLALSNVYSFENERLDLTVTRFLDSLSFKYKGFDIKLKEVFLRETYDDNITFVKKDKEEDFITDLGFGFGVNYEGKTRSLQLTGEITDQIFAKQPEQNNITQYLNLNFTNEFSQHDRIKISNVFSHFEAPSSSDGEGYFSAQFGRSTGRFEYFKNNFDIAYSNDVSKQITCYAKYSNEINVFSGTDRENSFLHKPGLGMSYVFSPTATIFSFSYDFTSIEFENDVNATIHTIGPGVRQYITKKLIFNGGAGVDIIDSYDDENFTKLYVRSALTYIIEEKMSANLSYIKKYDVNPYYESIFNNWRVSASLSRQILERMRVYLAVFYGDGEFVNFDGEQDFIGTRSSLRYLISSNLSGDFTYTYSDLNSDDEDSGYSKNTVFFGLTAEF